MFGSGVTLRTPLGNQGNTELLWGATSTPDLTTRSLGGFAQLQHKLNERWGAGGSFTWMKGREQPEGRDWLPHSTAQTDRLP